MTTIKFAMYTYIYIHGRHHKIRHYVPRRNRKQKTEIEHHHCTSAHYNAHQTFDTEDSTVGCGLALRSFEAVEYNSINSISHTCHQTYLNASIHFKCPKNRCLHFKKQHKHTFLAGPVVWLIKRVSCFLGIFVAPWHAPIAWPSPRIQNSYQAASSRRAFQVDYPTAIFDSVIHALSHGRV